MKAHPAKSASTRSRVLVYLNWNRLSGYYTCLDLCRELRVSRYSLSSLLTKMVNERQLVRRAGCGPKGGYGYALFNGGYGIRNSPRVIHSGMIS